MKFLEFYAKTIIFASIFSAFCKMIYKEDIVDRIMYLIGMLMIIPILIYLILI